MDQLDDGPPPPPVAPAIMERRVRVFVRSSIAWTAVGLVAYAIGPPIWNWFIFPICAAGNMATALIAETIIR